MAGKEDESYWQSTKIQGFNFDDEETSLRKVQELRKGILRDSPTDDYKVGSDSLSGSLSRSSLNAGQFGQTVTGGQHTHGESLEKLVSEKTIEQILQAAVSQPRAVNTEVNKDELVRVLRRQVEGRWTPPPVEDTIYKILLGQPYSLELYRSLNLKKDLLDSAIAIGDGNAILAVVLFLLKTLRKSLFYQLLMERPVAVAQYVQHLFTRRQVHELTDLLTMLGRSRDAAMKQYELAVQTQNPQQRQQKLKTCASNHFSRPMDKDSNLVANYIRLLEWQMSLQKADESVVQQASLGDIGPGNDRLGTQALVGSSVLSSLEYSCRHHWGEAKGSLWSPTTLCQQQGISDRQYQWTVLRIRSSLQRWEDIEALFTTKSWLGGRKVRAVIPMEKIVSVLHANDAPPSVLCQYLELIDNVNKRIAVAKKLQCHKAIIDVFVAQRDRAALVSYKTSLHPQTQDYFYAENALRVSTTKWKN